MSTTFKMQQRPRVFCASLADWLDDEVPIEWLADLLKLIHDTPNLIWLMLTKRPELFAQRMAACVRELQRRIENESHGASLRENIVNTLNWLLTWTHIAYAPNAGPENVHFGVSIENQKYADIRLPLLHDIPAKVKFVSCEPMIDRVDLKGAIYIEPDKTGKITKRSFVDQVIFGGESGPKARPCHVEWITEAVEQCRDAGIKVFVKQLGKHVLTDNANAMDWPDDIRMIGEGEGFAACRIHLKDNHGGDMAEWAEELQVREFPNPQSAIPNPQCP